MMTVPNVYAASRSHIPQQAIVTTDFFFPLWQHG
jgi:hypothetical protein